MEANMGSAVSDEQLDAILADIEQGIPLREICRRPDMPSKSTVYEFLKANEEANGRFARAREIGWDELAEETIEIADDRGEDPASRRVRVDTRLKLLSKWDPKRYGDKTEVTHAGAIALGVDLGALNPDQLRVLASIPLTGE
jgi:hypothetical protein